jgi:hypothetical protein
MADRLVVALLPVLLRFLLVLPPPSPLILPPPSPLILLLLLVLPVVLLRQKHFLH